MKTGLRLPFFYGWVIVASSFVILGLGYAVSYTFSVFFVAILEEFGWSRASTASIYSLFILAHGLTGPLVGWMVDRRGPRLAAILGTVVVTVGLVGTSRLNAIWQFYLFYGLLASMGLTAIGWVPNISVLNNWFNRRLGTALGITSGGIAFGMLVFVPLAQHLISSIGWRSTYLVLAAAIVVVILPLTLFVQRRHPQDMGLLADGATSAAGERPKGTESTAADPGWTSREWTVRSALATRRFWMAFASIALMNLAIVIVQVHQVALLVDAGYDKVLAASAVGAMGLAGLVGKLVWGSSSDRLGRETAFTMGMACGVVGVLLLVLARTAVVAWLPFVYGLWIGLGYAVLGPLGPALASDLFRSRNFASIMSLMNLGGSLGGAFSSWLAGYVFDLTGDYLLALALSLATILGSCATLWLAGPRKVRPVPGKVRDRDRDPVPVQS